MPLTIEVNAENQPHKVDTSRLKKAVRLILKGAGIKSAEISIAIITNPRMQELNRQYLKHDYATDVLSFVLVHDAKAKSLDGEIIASSEYAASQAASTVPALRALNPSTRGSGPKTLPAFVVRFTAHHTSSSGSTGVTGVSL